MSIFWNGIIDKKYLNICFYNIVNLTVILKIQSGKWNQAQTLRVEDVIKTCCSALKAGKKIQVFITRDLSYALM